MMRILICAFPGVECILLNIEVQATDNTVRNYSESQMHLPTRLAGPITCTTTNNNNNNNHNNNTVYKSQTSKLTRKAVLLQVVAVDSGGGFTLYSGARSGLVAQVMGANDADVIIPSTILPIRLPSIGAVDKEAAEICIMK